MSEPSMEEREAAWRRLREAGEQARRHGRFAEAEQHFLDALEEAERFGPEDPRLVESLIQLAGLYAGPGFGSRNGWRRSSRCCSGHWRSESGHSGRIIRRWRAASFSWHSATPW